MNDIYFDLDNLLHKIYIMCGDIQEDNYKIIANLIKDLIKNFWGKAN